ncbi:MAG: methyltransferase domain-containing protein [Rhizomicrobium sp.]
MLGNWPLSSWIECLLREVGLGMYSCPRCHRAKLEILNSGLWCAICNLDFPVVNGVPVLINNENSVFAVEDYMGADSYAGDSYVGNTGHTRDLRAAYRRFARALSGARGMPVPLTAAKVLAEVSRSTVERPRVLVVGAGQGRFSDPADVVYTDVAFSPGLNAIADAHDLPFGDCEFDLVIAIAVLEHVADPHRVVDEVWRVLKPHGCVFAATPFLEPVHMGAYDFTRFTYLGHRRLFRRFSDLASGIREGPGTVLAWSLQSLLISLFSGRNWRRVAKVVGLVITLPIKYLDRIAQRNPAAIDGAGGVFFFGRKSETIISDRELIKLYRGGFE